MRKMSQDCGDNTSITSGIENEVKKSGPGILKSTRNSIKRQVQNFSTESEDTAIEPLLHKSKANSEIEKQSAKFLLSKSKTDFASSKDSDKDKLLVEDKNATSDISDITGIKDGSRVSGLNDLKQDISQSLLPVFIYNHMNTNVFNSPEEQKSTLVTENNIHFEVDMSKPSGYAPSPLIFTTAKIHTDGEMQQMLPVPITPVPISSTIESGVVHAKELNKNKETALKSSGSPVTHSNLPEKYDSNGSIKNIEVKQSVCKVDVSTPLSSTEAQMTNINKVTSVESMRIKNGQRFVPNKEHKGPKVIETTIDTHTLQQVPKSYNISNSIKTDCVKTAPAYASSTVDKSCIEISKNVRPEPKPVGGMNIEDKTNYNKVLSSQLSRNSSIKIGIKPGPTSKEDKTMTNNITNAQKLKHHDSQENKIATCKLKSPDQQVHIITKNTNPTTNPVRVTKSSAKEQVSHNTINMSIAKTSTALSSKVKVDHIISPTNSNFKAKASTKSIPNNTKSGEINLQAKTSKTTDQEIISQSKPFDSKMKSRVSSLSDACKTTKSMAVTSASLSLQTNKASATVIANKNKTTMNKKSANTSTSATLSGIGNSMFSSTVSSKLITTADVSKLKSNNEATVVSSISKAITTPSISSSASSITTATSDAKHISSPSTVKTISSVPTLKSKVVGTVHHDKTSAEGVLTTVKPIFTVSNKTSLAGSTSNITVIPNDKVVATTSTKLATKPSTCRHQTQ